MIINDWTTFTKRIPIKADPQRIFDLWTTQTGLERWFLRKAEFRKPDNSLVAPDDHIQKGDEYEWYWYGFPNSVFEKNVIIETNEKDFLQFQFTAGCLVSVSITTEEMETMVEIVQENIPLDENPITNLFIACTIGWTFYLTNLKSIAEGGIDLRNKNIRLSNVINS